MIYLCNVLHQVHSALQIDFDTYNRRLRNRSSRVLRRHTSILCSIRQTAHTTSVTYLSDAQVAREEVASNLDSTVPTNLDSTVSIAVLSLPVTDWFCIQFEPWSMLQSSYDTDRCLCILKAEMSSKMTYILVGIEDYLRGSDQIGKFKPHSIRYNDEIPPGMSR